MRPGERPAPTPVALAVVCSNERFLVARRAAGTHLAGTWEFPGGKIAPGEEPIEAARRELREETGLEAGALEPLLVLHHEYPGRSLCFHVFLASEPAGVVKVEGDREWAWLGLAELGALDMPAANAPILRALRWRVP